MQRIEDYIVTINASKSPAEIFERFTQIIRDYGYDQVSYGCATDCPSLGLKKRHGHISNFSAGWLKHYAQNNLASVDPVHIHAVTKRTPSFWSTCEKDAPEKSVQLMRDAADVGLKSGAIFPLYETQDEISMVSVASDASPARERYETLAAINLLSAYFYEGYKSFLKKTEKVELSIRELEVLTWAAEGKTDFEIAAIIGLSAATVRYHWKNIFMKLNAHGRVYAVSKAIQNRLVTPYRVEAGRISG